MKTKKINFSIQYYPGSDTMKNFLYDLTNFINDRTTITGKELQNYINSTSVNLIHFEFFFFNSRLGNQITRDKIRSL